MSEVLFGSGEHAADAAKPTEWEVSLTSITQGDRLSATQVYVIDDRKTKNAFVLPGGKVFVFTGILPVAANDDGLATVLGHEVAHQGKSRA